MRRLVLLSVGCTLIGPGCGSSIPAPTSHEATLETQEAEAKRVFEVASQLESAGQPQSAAAAYRHIVRSFPRTAHSKKAGDRIRGLQRNTR